MATISASNQLPYLQPGATSSLADVATDPRYASLFAQIPQLADYYQQLQAYQQAQVGQQGGDAGGNPAVMPDSSPLAGYTVKASGDTLSTSSPYQMTVIGPDGKPVTSGNFTTSSDAGGYPAWLKAAPYLMAAGFGGAALLGPGAAPAGGLLGTADALGAGTLGGQVGTLGGAMSLADGAGASAVGSGFMPAGGFLSSIGATAPLALGADLSPEAAALAASPDMVSNVVAGYPTAGGAGSALTAAADASGLGSGATAAPVASGATSATPAAGSGITDWLKANPELAKLLLIGGSALLGGSSASGNSGLLPSTPLVGKSWSNTGLLSPAAQPAPKLIGGNYKQLGFGGRF